MAAVQNGTSEEAGDGGPRFKPEASTGLMMFMDIVNTVTHLTLGAVAFIVIFVSSIVSYNKLSQHNMILCTLGYVILMAQSILVMSAHNGWSRTIRYQNKKMVHLVMHIVGSIFAIIGCIIIFIEKTVHFDTTHGALGLVALILTILSLIGGVIHLYTCLPRVTCLLHCIVGALTLIIAFIAIIFGFDALFRPVFNNGTNTFIALVVLSLIGTLLPTCLKFQKGCF